MAQVVAQGSPRMLRVSVCDNYSYMRVEQSSIALTWSCAPALGHGWPCTSESNSPFNTLWHIRLIERVLSTYRLSFSYTHIFCMSRWTLLFSSLPAIYTPVDPDCIENNQVQIFFALKHDTGGMFWAQTSRLRFCVCAEHLDAGIKNGAKSLITQAIYRAAALC